MKDMADAHMRWHHLAEKPNVFHNDDSEFWAIKLWLDERWFAREDLVRPGILELIGAASSDDDLAYIGALALQGFICDDEDRLRWLESVAATSVNFCTALAYVFVWGVERDDVAARIETAAGVRLPRPPGWTGP